MLLPFLIALSLLPSASGRSAHPTPADAVITSGQLFEDDAGNPVHAHGAGLILPSMHPAGIASGKYYLVGASKKHNPSWLSEGINLYSSYDLQRWHFEGEIFHNSSITTPIPAGQGSLYRIERPKIIFNARTKLYVMYFHLDSASFGMGMVGVATSPTVAGQYTYVHGFQPDGQRSLDMGLFQETDGSGAAYLVRSVDNQYAGFSKLTDDYLNTTADGIISRGPRCEGQAVWRDGDTYFLLGSHLTGWSSNPAILASAKAPLRGATWTQLGNPSNDATTFNSQSTYVLPYRAAASGKTVLVYMGDRWNAGHTPNPYIWLPMVKNSSDPTGFTMAGLGDGHGDGQWKVADYLRSGGGSSHFEQQQQQQQQQQGQLRQPQPKVVEQDADTDFVCCELFNATNPPPSDWRQRYPGGVPGRPDTVPADNVTRCIEICRELFHPAPDRLLSCGAAAWNGPSKQCYLKTHKDKPAAKKGDVSFVLAV